MRREHAPTSSGALTLHTPRVRIGTWNLAAKWTPRHAAVLEEADGDVWLLTEVVDAVALSGYSVHLCSARMSPGQHYAGVMTRLPMAPLPDPHPASAAVRIGAFIYCSSVLPWAAKDDPRVWGDGNQGVRTAATVLALRGALVPGETVWGGDFNHALDGPTSGSGSAAGREAINGLADALELVLPTRNLPHRRPGILSIDHIGIPRTWRLSSADRVEVPSSLSDHDAYIGAAQPT